ncbi:MAG: UPF0158 family protein [Rectinemataceae bacterium]|nr:UPF0158 family protein [Rectinemataceae bacterium]
MTGEPTFELNDTILERIIFAMEDQTKSRVIDLRTGELVTKPEGELEVHLAPPPAWTPADGFRLMEGFCTRLVNLELKRALLKALSHGKGVFKAFRQVLSAFPQEDLQYREYKNAVLRRYIESWMDDMRESLGLARLGLEPEDYEELVEEEFTIKKGTLDDLPFDLRRLVDNAKAEALEWLPPAVALLEKAEIEEFLEARRPTSFIHYIAEVGEAPIAFAAGAIVQIEGRSIGIVRFIGAAKDFRDLGLESRLLERISTQCRELGVSQTIVRCLFIKPSFAELLAGKGYRIIGSQFLLE